MFKNTASQKLRVYAYDSTTNLPKSGDGANITAYVSKDYGAVTVLTDTSATEEDSTNAKGFYLFDLTQAETNADVLGFSAKSATANIVVIAVPAVVYTRPPNFSATSIDSNGRVDVIKVAGTTQTAGDIIADTNDIQSRLPAALVSGRIDASVGAMANNVMTAAAAAADLTTELQSGLATAASIAALNNLSAAQVNTEVDTALADIRLDELLAADSDIDGAAPPTVGSVFHELMTKTTGSFTYDQATDSLEALRDRGDAAWITATGFSTHSAADVWAVATRVLTAGTNIALAKGIGVTGFNDLDAAGVRSAVGLASANLDTQLTAIDDYLDTEVAAIKAKTDQMTFTTANRIDSQVYGMEANTVTASAIASDSVTEIQSGLATAAAVAALPTAAQNATAVLTTQLTEGYAADGVAPTVTQALMLMQQSITDFSIVGTTLTVKKLDGSTTAATMTLNDATSPTSVTRSG